MKKLLLTLGVLILFSGLVSAVECVIPTNRMNIIEDTTFCKGEYNLNQGILIYSNNVELDCNGANIIGNKTPFYNGIKLWGSNITIKNCQLFNFFVGVNGGSGENIIIKNNHIYRA